MGLCRSAHYSYPEALLSDSVNLCIQMLDAVLVSVQPILLRRILAAIEPTSTIRGTSPDMPFDMGSQLSIPSLLFAPLEVATRDIRSAYLYTFIAFVLLVLRANVSVVSQLYQRRFIVRLVIHFSVISS